MSEKKLMVEAIGEGCVVKLASGATIDSHVVRVGDDYILRTVFADRDGKETLVEGVVNYDGGDAEGDVKRMKARGVEMHSQIDALLARVPEIFTTIFNAMEESQGKVRARRPRFGPSPEWLEAQKAREQECKKARRETMKRLLDADIDIDDVAELFGDVAELFGGRFPRRLGGFFQHESIGEADYAGPDEPVADCGINPGASSAASIIAQG